MMNSIENYRSVSFIGLSKNAGKTTTLNYFINQTRGVFTLGLSSIGRDGENVDRVTGTGKPRIYIYKGTIIATSSDCMKLSDATLEILEVTDISTPMGKVVIARAISDGFVELAGPSTNYQTKIVIDKMTNYGADKIFVDGALSRKSFASPTVAEATILSTGASLSSNVGKIVEDTVHQCSMLTIPKHFDRGILAALQGFAGTMLIKGKNTIYFQCENTVIGNEKEILNNISSDTKILYTTGAITDTFVNLLLRNTGRDVKFHMIVKDGTKLFFSKMNYLLLQKKGISVYVEEQINLIGVTVNPYSANDYTIDADLLISQLKNHLNVPVYDVMNRSKIDEIPK